jgi:hypothetical protein
MNINDVSPSIINAIIYFYKYYNLKMFNKEIIIKHPDLLYNDLYSRIYNAWDPNIEIYSIELLYEPIPYWRTYNKLSEEDNILETLATYVDYLIDYQIRTDYSNTIITFNVDVPFEVGLKIGFGWIKQIIDIYR